jgi:membrane protein YdbS with pleckstrin-like domain
MDTSAGLILVALMATGVWIAVHGQPRWRYLGRVALVVIAASLIGLVIVSVDWRDLLALGNP